MIIGRQSSGEAHFANLAALPNLFISHSHDRQLPEIFTSFITQLLQTNPDFLFALSLASRIANEVKLIVPGGFLFLELLHQDYKDGNINSIDEFISALVQEMKKRKAFYKKWVPKLTMPPMLVFIDDIFEVIMLTRKRTALSFIELLISAANVYMYFIMGSSGIYRNLLEQLINVTPSLEKKLNKTLQAQTIAQPLGAEMVMNPDGLIFFREKMEKLHRRLYP